MQLHNNGDELPYKQEELPSLISFNIYSFMSFFGRIQLSCKGKYPPLQHLPFWDFTYSGSHTSSFWDQYPGFL